MSLFSWGEGGIANQPGSIEAETETIADKRNTPMDEWLHPNNAATAWDHLLDRLKAAIMLSKTVLSHFKNPKEQCDDACMMHWGEYQVNTMELLEIQSSFQGEETIGMVTTQECLHEMRMGSILPNTEYKCSWGLKTPESRSSRDENNMGDPRQQEWLCQAVTNVHHQWKPG